MKAKSGKTFPKSPRLFPLKEKKFSYPLLISTRNTALKREQIETRLQEETCMKGLKFLTLFFGDWTQLNLPSGF
jgi:hypothetical protein